MNRLALGTAQFGLSYGVANQIGQVSRVEVKSLLRLATAFGIDSLDTAMSYGDSEICLGEVGTHGFKLITKLPALPDNFRNISAWVEQQLNISLSRLGVSKIYGLLLHRPDDLLGLNGTALYQSLQALKSQGLIQKVGVSIYSPTELDELMPLYSFDIVQAPLNLVDQRLIYSGWLHRLKDKDVEIHTRSAFLQGLLLIPQAKMPSKFLPWENLWQIWYRWLATCRTSAVHASLAFPLSFPEIDRIIIGVDSTTQFLEIINIEKYPIRFDLPNLRCDDLDLINPSRWGSL